MKLVATKLEMETVGKMSRLVIENVEAIASDLTVLDSRLLLGNANIDVVALDGTGSLVLIAIDRSSDEQLLLKAVEAYSWCLEYPDAVRRLYPGADVSVARPPRVMFVVERMSDSFHRKVKQLGFPEVDCVEFRHLAIDGAEAVHFDTIVRLRRAMLVSEDTRPAAPEAAPTPARDHAEPDASTVARATSVKLQKLLTSDTPAPAAHRPVVERPAVLTAPGGPTPAREPGVVVSMMNRAGRHAVLRLEEAQLTSAPQAGLAPAAKPPLIPAVTRRPVRDAEPTPEPLGTLSLEPAASAAPMIELVVEPRPVLAPVIARVLEPEPIAAAEPVAAAAPVIAPVVEPEPIAAPAPAPAPEPVAAAAPVIASVVEPEPSAAPEPVAAAAPVIAPVVEPEPSAAPEPVAAAAPVIAPVVEPEPIAPPEPVAVVPEQVVEPQPIVAPEPGAVAPAIARIEEPVVVSTPPVAETVIEPVEPARAGAAEPPRISLADLSRELFASQAVDRTLVVAAKPMAPTRPLEPPASIKPAKAAGSAERLSFADLSKELLGAPAPVRMPQANGPTPMRLEIPPVAEPPEPPQVGEVIRSALKEIESAEAEPVAPVLEIAPVIDVAAAKPVTVASLVEAAAQAAPAAAEAPQEPNTAGLPQEFEGLKFPGDGVLTRQWMDFLNQMTATK